jgi:AraC family transcriptional activator of pobA
MGQKKYPTFDICNLVANKMLDDVFNADRFHGYLANNPHVQNVHKHSFYHLVYFTAGNGQHILDFESYPIQMGIIYFMRP